SDLSDGKGNTISANDIEVFQQKYIEIVKNFSPNKEIGAGSMVPDMLLPMQTAAEYKENKIEEGKNQGITVEITTTKDTVPGTYTGNFVLDLDGEKTQIPVTCEVWDIEYEGKDAMQTCFLLYRRHLLAGEYDNSDDMVRSYNDFLLKYNVNTYVIQDDWDVTEWIGEVQRLFESDNYNSIVIPYAFSRSYTAAQDGDKVINFIRELVKISTEEKPYIDYAFFYPTELDEADHESGAAGSVASKTEAAHRMLDEGGEMEKTLQSAVSRFEAEGLFNGMSAEFAEHVKQSVANIPCVFTNVNFNQPFVDSIDASFCPYLSVFNDNINAGKYGGQRERSGKNTWTYTCVGPLYPYPSFHTDDYALGARVTGWMQKKYNVSGFLYWSVAKYDDSKNCIDPYTTAARYAGIANGDGYLLYPGRKYGSAAPFASVRLAEQRNSSEDYNMLTVYENLLNERAAKYGVAVNFEDYVNDLYDELFSGAIYRTDDSLVFEAREKLAGRILDLKKAEGLFVTTGYGGKQVDVSVYAETSSLSINGAEKTGVAVNGGYKYDVTLPTASAQKLVIVTANGEYVCNLAATGSVTDFAQNGSDGVVCTGRTSDPSTMSTAVAEDDKLNVTIRSYYANGGGYGTNVAPGGIDGATQRLMPSVTFTVGNLTGAENVCFNVKNTGSTNLELYVQLIMENGITEEIG
ncbi:MAG: glycoside hydrolase domain-containing protein, partial [Candidatus Scatosoma sp.]